MYYTEGGVEKYRTIYLCTPKLCIHVNKNCEVICTFRIIQLIANKSFPTLHNS